MNDYFEVFIIHCYSLLNLAMIQADYFKHVGSICGYVQHNFMMDIFMIIFDHVDER